MLQMGSFTPHIKLKTRGIRASKEKYEFSN